MKATGIVRRIEISDVSLYLKKSATLCVFATANNIDSVRQILRCDT